MGVGRGEREALAPWILKLLAKKVVFSISRGKKQISPLLAPPGKNFGKIPYWPPLEKIFPTPMYRPVHDRPVLSRPTFITDQFIPVHNRAVHSRPRS